MLESGTWRSQFLLLRLTSENVSVKSISDVCLCPRNQWAEFFAVVCVQENRLRTFRDPPPPHHSRIARDSAVLSEAVSYTRSARTIRRFWKVGIGVQVCNISMSLPRSCPITHESVGSARNVSLRTTTASSSIPARVRKETWISSVGTELSATAP